MADVLVDRNLLKTLVPPNALNRENFQELASKTFIESVAKGRSIFKEGDSDRKSVYVLQGKVGLTSNSGKTKVIEGGGDIAKHPIANQQPRQFSAVAQTACEIIRIDSDLLDILLTWDQMSGIYVGEIQVEEETLDEEVGLVGDDWMTRILQSKAFLQVPPANIQAMFMRMDEIEVKEGDVIINQGEEGDYYYLIKKGKAKVARTSKTGSELVLATLRPGDAFGEEALLSEAKRNANIIMVKNGVLMRLAKKDFNELLKEPMLTWVDKDKTKQLVKQGAVLIDVRLDTEHKNSNIRGSINIPLFMLRMKADSLDPNKQYITYCDTGRRSSAGAYLLSERGLKSYCLQGGLNALSSSS